MRLNKKPLANVKLYLILDAQVLGHDALLRVLKDSVRSGIDSVQLRDKIHSAKEILAFCRKALKITRHRVPFILNDRLDLAILSGADGVHVGQDDVSLQQARHFLGPAKLIGVSCQSWAQVQKAQTQGADYIGFGSVFETKTKPQRRPMDLSLLKWVTAREKVPVFPIGGISRKNIGRLTALGVKRVAVCRDILLAPDPGQAVREFKEILRG